MAHIDIRQLCSAIDKAEPDALRDVLKRVCTLNIAARDAIAPHFLVVAEESKKRKNAGDDENLEDQSTTGAKRHAAASTMTSRYEKCITCDETFDVSENDAEACRTHKEALGIDMEFFCDDEEITYRHAADYVNDWSTNWRSKENPEGFHYPCCDAKANGEACVIQRHVGVASEQVWSGTGWVTPPLEENTEVVEIRHGDDGRAMRST